MAAELSRPDKAAPKEMAFTENVSARGVRITTAQRWQPGTCVLLTFPQNGMQSLGRIIYCQRVAGGSFCVGRELPGQVQELWQTLADVRFGEL